MSGTNISAPFERKTGPVSELMAGARKAGARYLGTTKGEMGYDVERTHHFAHPDPLKAKVSMMGHLADKGIDHNDESEWGDGDMGDDDHAHFFHNFENMVQIHNPESKDYGVGMKRLGLLKGNPGSVGLEKASGTNQPLLAGQQFGGKTMSTVKIPELGTTNTMAELVEDFVAFRTTGESPLAKAESAREQVAGGLLEKGGKASKTLKQPGFMFGVGGVQLGGKHISSEKGDARNLDWDYHHFYEHRNPEKAKKELVGHLDGTFDDGGEYQAKDADKAYGQTNFGKGAHVHVTHEDGDGVQEHHLVYIGKPGSFGDDTKKALEDGGLLEKSAIDKENAKARERYENRGRVLNANAVPTPKATDAIGEIGAVHVRGEKFSTAHGSITHHFVEHKSPMSAAAYVFSRLHDGNAGRKRGVPYNQDEEDVEGYEPNKARLGDFKFNTYATNYEPEQFADKPKTAAGFMSSTRLNKHEEFHFAKPGTWTGDDTKKALGSGESG